VGDLGDLRDFALRVRCRRYDWPEATSAGSLSPSAWTFGQLHLVASHLILTPHPYPPAPAQLVRSRSSAINQSTATAHVVSQAVLIDDRPRLAHEAAHRREAEAELPVLKPRRRPLRGGSGRSEDHTG
jgi:hypothetical protein